MRPSRSAPKRLRDGHRRDTALVLVEQPRVALGRLELVADRARDYARAARADNTVRAYRAAWTDFMSWCEVAGCSALPADPVAVSLYLTEQADAGLKAATLQLRLTAIARAHKMAGLDSPTRAEQVSSVWAGIRRKIGTAQQGKDPALVEDLRVIINSLTPRRGQAWRALDLRDRALLLIGFAGAFRRSELVAINVEDLEFTRGGVVILQRRGKTDQEGRGRKVGIPLGHGQTCPVRALRGWLEGAGIQSGPVFRRVNRHGQVLAQRLSGEGVAIVVKRRAEAVGMDPDRLGGHSLRAGLATSAATAGASERKIQAQTGHKSLEMLRRYIRDGELFIDNAAAVVGL